MSEGTFPPPDNVTPPKKSSGGKTILFAVLGVVLLGGLCCCGGIFGIGYFGVGEITKIRDAAMSKVSVNAEVQERLGTPIVPSLPHNSKVVNQSIEMDFNISGPKGSGMVHTEGFSGPNGFEPIQIIVTIDGEEIDVNTESSDTEIEIPIPAY